MKTCMLILLTGILTSASLTAEPTQSPATKMEGTWKVISMEAIGMPVTDKSEGLEKAVIKDSKLTLYANGKALKTATELRMQFDPKQPTALDLVRGEKESLPCLIRLEADKFTLALPMFPSKPVPGFQVQRPGSFDTKGKPVIVFVAKRVKH